MLWRWGAPLPAQRPRSLADFITACQSAHGQRTVLVDAGRVWSWDALLAGAERIAAAGQDAGWLRPGVRIAIVAGNSAAHLLAQLAAWLGGAIAAPLWPGFDTATLGAVLRQIEPSLIVSESVGTPAVPGSQQISGAALCALASDAGRPRLRRWMLARPSTPALILQTSGSGGLPKGVLLSQGNIVSQQVAFGMLWPEVGHDDRLAAYLPWHHSFGCLAEGLWALGRGACVHIVHGLGRDRQALLATLAQVRPTIWMSVPKLHRTVREAAALDMSALRWAFSAGAPIARAESDWYAAHRVPLYEGWGLTECSPSACISAPGQPRAPGVVGPPIPGVGVGVREDGRVLVQGPGVMLGYWRDAAATAQVIDAEGSLDSGDLGCWDATGLRLLGRANLLAKLSSGEWCDLGRIEQSLEAQPGVRHALAAIRDGCVVVLLGATDAATAGAAVCAVNAAGGQRISQVWWLGAGCSVADGRLTPSHKIARRTLWDAFCAGRCADAQAVQI